MGRRTAASRIAHLLLEVFTRLKLIGRVKDNSFRVPLTQVHLGEAVGVTSVHVNRTIRELRAQGLIEVVNGTVIIHDEDKLRELAGFDPLYLHTKPNL